MEMESKNPVRARVMKEVTLKGGVKIFVGEFFQPYTRITEILIVDSTTIKKALAKNKKRGFVPIKIYQDN